MVLMERRHLFYLSGKKRSSTAKCDKSHCRNYCVLSIIHAEDSGPRPGARGTVSEPGRYLSAYFPLTLDIHSGRDT